MATPNITVEIGVFNGFQLDSPEFGLLDTGVLDGDVDYTTVPQGLFAVSTSRGRNRDIGKTSAGSLSISFRNEDRFFDPSGNSTFASLVAPRLPVRVTAGTERVFTGFVDDWDFQYSPSGESVASLTASDAFTVFARNINGGGSAISEGSGARLNRVLDQDEVNWTGGRDIATGQATLAAGLLKDAALDYMLDVVEQSELGLLFMSKSGDVTFRSRLLSATGSAVTFADDGSGIPFASVDIQYGSEELVNRAIVTGPSGTAIAEDLGSQVKYGITAEEIDTQVSTLTQQESIADFLIDKFSEPELRVQSVTINLNALTSEQQDQVLALEIGDQAGLTFTPNQIAPTLNIANRVIGISHDIGPAEHLITFNLRRAPYLYFVLDSAEFGRLDATDVVLGF